MIFGFPQEALGVFRGYFATESYSEAEGVGRALTLQSSGRYDVLVHVVHVIRHNEVLGRGPATYDAGVKVQGGGQGGEPRVIDDGEPSQNLNLLPTVQPLPQSSSHLTQGLSGPEERRGRRGGQRDTSRDHNVNIVIGDIGLDKSQSLIKLTWLSEFGDPHYPDRSCVPHGRSQRWCFSSS